jgi:hypothetical protein
LKNHIFVTVLGLKDFLSGFFQAMQGKNGANTDVFASILTKQ